MKTWSFYNLETGRFTGQTFRGPESMLEANTPPGCGAKVGRFDRATSARSETVSEAPEQSEQPAQQPA
jgi:hypothetical protein